jgi:DNA-binding SARP family transcriptional activator/TolB-like protein
MSVLRAGREVALPASRKARALLAYLALAARPVARSQLCELLWDVPNDPRGELRWCLSKIRGIVDDAGCRRVTTRDDLVRLELGDCAVDALAILRATDAGLAQLEPARQRELAALFTGDFLEGLEIDRNPVFNGWLAAQRRRFRSCHAALLELLVRGATDDNAFGYLEQWLQLAPYDPHVHDALLERLARQGRVREAEEHLATTARLFESEGLDTAALRSTWRSIRSRARAATAAPIPPATADAGNVAADCVDPVHEAGAAISVTGQAPGADAQGSLPGRRASIAVMPFHDLAGDGAGRGGTADALAHDIITRLAKLRSMFVIAQGTVFALHERRIGAEDAGRMLNVDYTVGGSVRSKGGRLTVNVELAESRTGRIIWAETFNEGNDDAFLVLDEIGNRIVASIASEIETTERNRAILRPPSSLDAWEAHHRGLWHMYRFSKADNERARHFFESAIRLDPTFARAYSGLSFAHWQNAFQGWEAREQQVDLAYEAAGQSLLADDRDPAAHWAMGRALWLRGRHDQAVIELEHTIDLSPNFALGHYTLSFVHSQAGDPHAAISSSDHSRHLSPFDPLLFGMLGTRAMALVRLGNFKEAADWAVKAAARPNAHPHILAIAAFSLSLAGMAEEARSYAAAIRRALPNYAVSDFLAAFRFDPDGELLFREGAKRIGMA